MSTARAGRASKDKPAPQNAKAEGPPVNAKNVPTAEQIRLAHIITDKHEEDPEVKAKVKQVSELTGKNEDDSLLALHDCHYDLNRAVEQLLENKEQDGWTDVADKKKKKQAMAKPEPQMNNSRSDERREKSRDREQIDTFNDRPERDSMPSSKGRRERGPPRFQRGRGRDKPSEDDRNRGDNSQSRDRGFGDRGRGRGRGGTGRGRGRGRGRENFRGTRFDKPSSQTDGPQIDTWTNDQAKAAEKENIGAWSDMAEDWTGEEWTGNLEETKVFTASGIDAKFSAPNDNDAKMFTTPATIEGQVFTASSLTNSTTPPTLR